jgi:hypothetical protein
MLHSNRRRFIQFLTGAAAAGMVLPNEGLAETKEAPGVEAASKDTVSIVSKHTIVATAPPSHIPNQSGGRWKKQA